MPISNLVKKAILAKGAESLLAYPSEVKGEESIDDILNETLNSAKVPKENINSILNETLNSANKPKNSIDSILNETLSSAVSGGSVPGQVALPNTVPTQPETAELKTPFSLSPPGPPILESYVNRVNPLYQEQLSAAKERFTKPESNIIDKVIGSLQYVGSPITALTGSFLGEPTSRGLQATGVSKKIADPLGSLSELLVPTGGIGAAVKSSRALKTGEILKQAYGLHSFDPALNAQASLKLKSQRQQASAWEKYIGPKFDSLSDKIGDSLKKIGIAENLTPQQQIIKQFRVKKRESQGEISSQFTKLYDRVKSLPLEEQDLFSTGLSKPELYTGSTNVDSLIKDVHTAVADVTKGIPITKDVEKKVAMKALPDETPLYHGSKSYQQGNLVESRDGDFGPGIYFATTPKSAHIKGAETSDINEVGSSIIPAYFKGKVVNYDAPEFETIAKKYDLKIPSSFSEGTDFNYYRFYEAVRNKFKLRGPDISDELSKSRVLANRILESEGIDAIKGPYADKAEQYAIINSKSIRYIDQPIFETSKQKVLVDLADEIPGLLGERGITKTIPKEDLETYKEYGFTSLGAKPESKTIQVNRKFSEDELGQLTELDTSANYIANIGKSLSDDVSAFQLYDDIAKYYSNKEIVPGENITSKTPGYRKISDRKIKGTDLYQKGALAGKIFPEDLANDIEFTDDFRRGYANTPIIKQYLKANQFWKTLHTAYNPKVVFNNYVSAAITFDVAANAKYSSVVTGIKELKRKGSLYQLAKKQGLFQSGFIRSEGGLATDVLDAHVNSIEKSSDLSSSNVIQTGIKLTDKLTKSALKTHANILEVYNMGDDIWRFGVFIDRLEKGFSPIEAAADARRLLLDYDINAPVISVMRDSTHPFISYPYRIIPVLMEAAVKHPIKFGKWVVLDYGLKQALTEDEKKSINLLPERQKGTVLGIPGAPSTLVKVGKNKVLNTQGFIPGGNVFEATDFGIPYIPQSLQLSGGLAGAIAKPFVLGEGPFGDKLLELPTSNSSKLKARTESFLESNVPNIPGIPFAPSTKKIRQAISGQYSPYQDPKSLMEAALGTVGIDVINLDKKRLIRVQSQQLKENLKMLGQMKNKIKFDFKKGLLNEEQFKIELLKNSNEGILLKAKHREKIK